MDTLDTLLNSSLEANDLQYIVISHPKIKTKQTPQKITIRPVVIKKTKMFQMTEQVGPKALHGNGDKQTCKNKLINWLKNFREAHFFVGNQDHHLWFNKKGSMSIKTTLTTIKDHTSSHNREKNYLLKEGIAYPFFIALGVMDREGKIYAKKRDKFLQVNRFLEIVNALLKQTTPAKRLKIVDLGCGKAYLTFALYHFLHIDLGLEVEITGVDLKEDVIQSLNKVSKECNFTGLHFQCNSIERYASEEAVDMVIALHACNLATDYAIAKAVQANAKMILIAPCCQHEFLHQIDNPLLEPLLKHGILKERFASLVTDACRAALLESAGYQTQILEFIDSEHTPKNLLIKAIKSKKNVEKDSQYFNFKNALHLMPKLEVLLQKKSF
ncbi:hypothetical protein PHSC3_001292 [Chlamydiales bacterium STE3]|nr:hypothetical protein PHSC3_001292 [Chlamydiales bacterium STE3]